MDYIFQSADPKIKPEYFAVAVIIAILAGVVTECCRRQGKLTKTQSVAVVSLTVYIFLVFASTVFSRVPKDYYNYKLVPFWSYRQILKGSRSLFWEDALNVVMLFPVGVLFPMAMAGNRHNSKKLFRRTVLTGFLIALVIECLQLILMRGLFEFDDMFHNTIGVAIGCWCYRRVQIIRKAKKKCLH